jgi:hypothetical protein
MPVMHRCGSAVSQHLEVLEPVHSTDLRQLSLQINTERELFKEKLADCFQPVALMFVAHCEVRQSAHCEVWQSALALLLLILIPSSVIQLAPSYAAHP